MEENEARKYIKNLILTRSPLRDLALAHFEKAFGHPFWSKETPVRSEGVTNLSKTSEEIAKQIGLIEK